MFQKLSCLLLFASAINAFADAVEEDEEESSSIFEEEGPSIFHTQEERPSILCLNNNTVAKCVDPWDHRVCIPGASKKAAITVTFDQYSAWELNSTWYEHMKQAADLSRADLVLLLPAEEAPEDKAETKPCNTLSTLLGVCSPGRIEIPKSEMQEIEKYFKVVRVPWVVPPGLSKFIPRFGKRGGVREFMKLHAVGLEDYDAVLNLDPEFTVHGSLEPIFQCAASGKFLTSRTSKSGVNSGIFATRPSKSLLYDLLVELMSSSASEETGWNHRGLAPGATEGSSGLQGFLYYYFYQRGPSDETVSPGQLNPCKWTGQAFCPTEDCFFTPLRQSNGIYCPDNLTSFSDLKELKKTHGARY